MEDEHSNSRIEDTHNNRLLEDEHYTVRAVRKTCTVSIWGNNDQEKIAIALHKNVIQKGFLCSLLALNRLIYN